MTEVEAGCIKGQIFVSKGEKLAVFLSHRLVLRGSVPEVLVGYSFGFIFSFKKKNRRKLLWFNFANVFGYLVNTFAILISHASWFHGQWYVIVMTWTWNSQNHTSPDVCFFKLIYFFFLKRNCKYFAVIVNKILYL